MTKITPFLWFDGRVEEAVAFYISVFKDARVEAVSPMMATFELAGQRFHALNGGPQYKFNEAVSFFVLCDSQVDIDYYWSGLAADGGEEGRCGWLKDKFGLSWQVVPEALGRLMGDKDRERGGRVMQAMLKMKKLDISELETAHARQI